MSKRLESRNTNNVAPLASQHVRKLRAAVLSPCPAEYRSACSEIRSAGVGLNDLTDRYIPAVARTLGKEWSEDHVTFASTTVGAARLQWLMRLLEPTSPYPEIAADLPGILILVPAGEQHTLGAILLSSQLRRRGFYVNLVLDAVADSVEFRMRKANFQATMISTSPGPQMSDLRALVAASRRAMEKDAPVLVGGTITETNLDLTELSGADYVATEVDDALRRCAFDVRRAVAETT